MRCSLRIKRSAGKALAELSKPDQQRVVKDLGAGQLHPGHVTPSTSQCPQVAEIVATVASDKLFFWLFQDRPDRILELLGDPPLQARGYRFSAPVLKVREYRLDGLFLPPPDQPDLPAIVLEAQMATDPGFYRRLYAESARWLQQHEAIRH